ncbi:hypothetical protein [Methanotorris igneus]|uniref:Uncharacterized protein n=1 Tax=Methanotorris igneus (strain DSM 5666 / JCM 11834 / Kol 5) TaxID=880724 RepID=F6BDG5_METIK|nr:hypothetical protein [Methanotorris igneus]AEF96526.1 hypothetical protein Metig_0984 [Methanotorris igneus Kol 5]
MKERLLVLAKAAPVQSAKYRYLVCVAGITESGEWRRIFPIPWEVFSGKSKNKFTKKQWIEYELVEDKSPDGRPESRKIKKQSITPLHTESYKSIKKLLEERLTDMETLQNKKRQECSLGVVKPIIKDMVWTDREVSSKDDVTQLTLDGTEFIRLEPLDKKFQYVFKCSPTCPTEHKIMCEDWEIEELYRKLKKKYDENKACNLVRDKFLNKIYYEGHTYFIVGTHNRWNTWLIVSVLYPKKEDLKILSIKSLDEFM